tara:strand:- start:1858 stop:2385 length:528 start_codon:yes stop_codon:yes gene_type:complete
MAVYTVLLPPPAKASGIEQTAERTVFVRDGFSWLAMLFPVLWLLFNGLWLLLLAFLLVAIGLELGLSLIGGPVPGLAGLALAVLFGFEANGLRRWALMRRGYRFAGIVSGAGRVDCERRFFDSWLAEGAHAAAPVPPPARKVHPEGRPAARVAPSPLSPGDPGIFGLFPDTRNAR